MASQSHNFCQMNKLLPPLNPFLFTQFLSKRRFYCIFKRFSPSPLQKHKFDSSSFPERLHGSLWQFGSPKIDRFGNFCGNYARERPSRDQWFFDVLGYRYFVKNPLMQCDRKNKIREKINPDDQIFAKKALHFLHFLHRFLSTPLKK